MRYRFYLDGGKSPIAEENCKDDNDAAKSAAAYEANFAEAGVSGTVTFKKERSYRHGKKEKADNASSH